MRGKTLVLAILIGSALPSLALAADTDSAIAAAVAAAVPRDLVEAKAREGEAKGIPLVRIEAALTQLATNVGRVRPLLPEHASADLLGAAARAIREGASEGAIRRVGAFGPAVRLRAMESLADLTAVGLLESDLLHLLETAASSPEPAIAVTGLSSAGASMAQSGSSPSEVSSALMDVVVAGQSPLTTPTPPQTGSGNPPSPPTGGGPPGGN